MSMWSSWFGLAPNSLTQSILPDWSFMTINENNSSAPGTEQKIVSQDSYGRQIGRMMDVLEVLVAREPSLRTTTRSKPSKICALASIPPRRKPKKLVRIAWSKTSWP